MSASDKFVQPAIPKFDGHYDFWSMTMENFLRSKELWSLVENGIPATMSGPVSEAQKKAMHEAKLKDLKVKNFLFQAIDREILETIIDKGTSQAIWNSMKQKYQGSTRVKRAQLQALRREFELLSMTEGEKIDSFLGRTLTVVNKMKSNGEIMEQSTVVGKILRSLTPKFNYVVCAIEESNDMNVLTIDELHGSLLVHEQRMQGTREEEHVLKATHDDTNRITQDVRSSRGRGRGLFRGGRGRGRGRQSLNKATIECFKCHKLGHFQYECPDWEKQANYVEFDEEEEILLMAREEQHAQEEERWYFDSGCSNHMTGNKAWFLNLENEHCKTVKLGNDTHMTVVAKGSIRMHLNGITQVLTEVYYIPELKNNLLSIGQLQEKGLSILISNGSCKVFHTTRGLIMKTEMSGNRMFYVTASLTPTKSLCLQTETVSAKEAYLWHCRFGHLNYKALSTLANSEMVVGLPTLTQPQNTCHTCLTGKQSRRSFPSQSSWRASKRLQLVHSDICGPIQPASHSDKRYFLSFIDDFTRKTWVYFLHEKSEALAVFKNFKARVEKEAEAYIMCLRTDRGGEFLSNEFEEFCRTQGIRRQLTTSYTPQQNGVVERKNRTIMNAVRSMLSEKQVPKVFWPEAVRWCVHIQNRCPTVAMDNVTPEEAWSGQKPVVDYFKVFGCVAHAHIPDQRRIKLDDKSRKCVFLGVSDESKAWRLYDPVTKTVIISRDVVFEEEERWDWSILELKTQQEELDCEDEGDTPGENHHTTEEVEEVDANEEGRGAHLDNNSLDSAQGRGARARRAPRWLTDYDTGAGLSEEENL